MSQTIQTLAESSANAEPAARSSSSHHPEGTMDPPYNGNQPKNRELTFSILIPSFGISDCDFDPLNNNSNIPDISTMDWASYASQDDSDGYTSDSNSSTGTVCHHEPSITAEASSNKVEATSFGRLISFSLPHQEQVPGGYHFPTLFDDLHDDNGGSRAVHAEVYHDSQSGGGFRWAVDESCLGFFPGDTKCIQGPKAGEEV